MKLDELVAYCLAKPGATEDYPRGDEELVAKVGGKGFAFIWLEGDTVGLKCGRDAAEAGDWRERYPDAISQSGYIGRTARRRCPGRRDPRARRRFVRRCRRQAAEVEAPLNVDADGPDPNRQLEIYRLRISL